MIRPFGLKLKLIDTGGEIEMQKDSDHVVGGKSEGAVASHANGNVFDEPTEDESLIACLGDDAAKLMQENPGDEMATTMLVAARRLEALLAALPKTADGIPIVPGMIVHCIVGAHVDERHVIGPYGKLALLTSEPARHGAGPGQCHRLANTVYSTREAAKSGIGSNEPQTK